MRCDICNCEVSHNNYNMVKLVTSNDLVNRMDLKRKTITLRVLCDKCTERRFNMELENYNLRQVSSKLGIKVRTIREWIKNGKLNAFKDERNHWYVTPEEIKRILEER